MPKAKAPPAPSAAQGAPPALPAVIPAQLRELVPLGEGVRELDLSAASGVCHLLTPVTSLKAAEGLLLWPSVAVLDPEDYYPSIGKPGHVSLAKSGLMKLADALGIEEDYVNSGWGSPPPCMMCAERAERAGSPRAICSHNIAYKAVGWVTALDGSRRPVVGEKVWDFDDIKRQVAVNADKKRKKFADGRERPLTDEEKREYIGSEIGRLLGSRHAMCETKAWLRMIRKAAKVRADYNQADARKPFLAVRVQADLSPAEVKARAMGATRALYGSVGGLGATPMIAAPEGEAAGDDFDDGGFVGAEGAGGKFAAEGTGAESAPAPAASGDSSGTQEQSPAGEPASETAGEPVCPQCGAEAKHIPAGTSKKTGKPYSAFWACKDDCGWRGGEPEWQRDEEAVEAEATEPAPAGDEPPPPAEAPPAAEPEPQPEPEPEPPPEDPADAAEPAGPRPHCDQCGKILSKAEHAHVSREGGPERCYRCRMKEGKA